MTSTQDTAAIRTPSGRRSSGGGKRAYAPKAFEVRGAAAKALATLGLVRRDARLVLIPSSAAAEVKLRQVVRGHLQPAGRLPGRAEPDPVNIPPRKTPVIDKTAFVPDARSQALLAGLRIAQQDLREAGGAFTLDEVCALMHGISRQRVDRRVKDGTLLAVPGPSNRRVYPTVQFLRDGSVVAGLAPVLAALPTRNPWAVLNCLTRPDRRLGDRPPIDLLKAGDVASGVDAAQRMAEQGA